MNKKQKKTLERILIAVALVIVLKLLPALPMPVELALYCIPYLVVGWDVLRKAHALSRASEGAFDITLGARLVARGVQSPQRHLLVCCACQSSCL